ncbi:MAG: carbonic anhydrase [Ignavibacteriaceae bacterium]|jgi:carbonic anhydrase|nr:carbonic anhydrase [Ignavibacteriaceae bacterium]
MDRLIRVNKASDIPAVYQNTPIGLLIEYHNLKRKFDNYTNAQLLIGMCMDHRNNLHIPEVFTYRIRTGGANLRYSEFKVSFAISIGGVKHIALIGHSDCGMVNLMSKKEQFVQKLSENAGWSIEQAEEHFNNYALMFEINNEIDFILSETLRLRQRYPKVQIAPIHYKVEDNLLYFIKED